MTVTDGDRFAIAMAKLSQARSAVYEATRIIEHLFESNGGCPEIEIIRDHVSSVRGINSIDPVTGLYPGQKPDISIVEDEEQCEE